jgi:hypothetical protein
LAGEVGTGSPDVPEDVLDTGQVIVDRLFTAKHLSVNANEKGSKRCQILSRMT